MQPFKQSQSREWPHEGRWWRKSRSAISIRLQACNGGTAMANIIKFPKAHREPPAARRQELPRPVSAAKAPASKWRRFCCGLFGSIWLIITVLSPLLEWVLKYDVVFQFFRMLYYWNTPEKYAGWTFLLHFSAMTLLICYVAFGKPKGFDVSRH
jgi:hypothetical protein